MTDEIYKSVTIKEVKDILMVSNKGNVKNIITSTILTLSKKMGYHYVSTDVNFKTFGMRVHRLVALAFIPNDDKTKKFVNHINGNKLDNRVENLEWVTPQHNVQHAYDNKLIKPFERKVCKCDMDGNVIETFNSLKTASEKTGIHDAGIVKVCKGKRQTAGGFKWKYFEIFENEKIDGIDMASMKHISNFPNYMISKDGKVFSIRYKKYLKSQINPDGYETIQLQNNAKKSDFLVHRLVALAFIDKPEEKDFVNHKNGIKIDNTINNLEWVTHSENMQHYYRKIKISTTKS